MNHPNVIQSGWFASSKWYGCSSNWTICRQRWIQVQSLISKYRHFTRVQKVWDAAVRCGSPFRFWRTIRYGWRSVVTREWLMQRKRMHLNPSACSLHPMMHKANFPPSSATRICQTLRSVRILGHNQSQLGVFTSWWEILAHDYCFVRSHIHNQDDGRWCWWCSNWKTTAIFNPKKEGKKNGVD